MGSRPNETILWVLLMFCGTELLSASRLAVHCNLKMVIKLSLSVSMCNVFKTAVFYVSTTKHGRHIGIMSTSALSHFFVFDQ